MPFWGFSILRTNLESTQKSAAGKAGLTLPSVQSPATIDATAIQQCLFCTEAMTFVKTMQTPVTAKNKTDSGSGFSQIFDSGFKNKRRIVLEATPYPWPPLLGSIAHKISNLQLKIRYHDPFNKHPGDDYFTIYLQKVLLAWIFNACVNCVTPYKQAEMNST